MSSNSVDFEIEKLKKELTESIDALTNQQDRVTFATLRALCQSIVDRYYYEGVLERQPIIDINHKEEIAYFQTLIETYVKKAYTATTKEEAIHYKDQAVATANRVNSLKEATKDPNRLQVFLKEPYTYEPFDWTKYEF